jgi:hypothetical protein
MLMGRKVLEALLVYSRINVMQTLLELKPKKADKKEEGNEEEKACTITIDQAYLELSYESIHKELSENKQLIKLTEGAEEGEGGGSSGSESDPSEDNMEEDEIAKYVPIKPPKKKVPEKRNLSQRLRPRKRSKKTCNT